MSSLLTDGPGHYHDLQYARRDLAEKVRQYDNLILALRLLLRDLLNEANQTDRKGRAEYADGLRFAGGRLQRILYSA